MKRKAYALLLCFGLSTAIPTAIQHAHAALGELADSVVSDRKLLSALPRATTHYNGYIIQEIESDSTVIREYISPSGIVFGIAWNGLTHPDLMTLLGSYAREYQTELSQSPRKPGRRYAQLKAERVVVEKWGQMRNLKGRAYAPELIPPGVSADAIR